MRVTTPGLDSFDLPHDVVTALRVLAADASTATQVDDRTALVAALRAGITALRAQLDTDPHAVLRALVDGGAELDVADLVFAASDLRHRLSTDHRARRIRREDT